MDFKVVRGLRGRGSVTLKYQSSHPESPSSVSWAQLSGQELSIIHGQFSHFTVGSQLSSVTLLETI
jgi:hypothetical protein